MVALSIYLDTSIVVPLFLPDLFVDRARRFFATGPSNIIVSDLAAAEFAAVAGIRRRTGNLTAESARKAFANFDAWTVRSATSAETKAADLRSAQTSLRMPDISLRAPDAIHIAIARRLGAELASFDERMVVNARILGVRVVAL